MYTIGGRPYIDYLVLRAFRESPLLFVHLGGLFYRTTSTIVEKTCGSFSNFEDRAKFVLTKI
jgi:hypothetical protein